MSLAAAQPSPGQAGPAIGAPPAGDRPARDRPTGDALGDAPRASLTDRGRALIAAGVILSVAGWALGFVDLFRVGLLAVILPLISLIMARRRLEPLRVSRRVDSARVTAGTNAQILATLHNPGPRATPVLLGQELLSANLGAPTRFVLGPIPAGGQRTLAYAIWPRRRGAHTVGPLRLVRRDPFGLTTAGVSSAGSLDIVALPVVHPLTGMVAAAGIGADGSSPAMLVIHGEHDASIRGYRQGDDLRRIHWPVTAHRGELMVRHEGRPTVHRALLLLLDPHGTADPRPPAHQQAGLDWAVEAMASVACHLDDQGYALHLLTPASLATGHGDGRAPIPVILRELALLQPAPPLDTGGLGNPLLARARDLLAGGGLLVAAVFDHDPASARAVLNLRPPGLPGIVFVVDTHGFGAAAPVPGRVVEPAQALVAAAADRGWAVSLVDGSRSVPEAWSALTRSPAVPR